MLDGTLTLGVLFVIIAGVLGGLVAVLNWPSKPIVALGVAIALACAGVLLG